MHVGPSERDAELAVEEFLKTPLFMQAAPTEDDIENNDTMAALQSLIYEGPAEEVALNFKNQGNDCFKAGPTQYKNALAYYTKGLHEKGNDVELNVTLLVNRAAVNLELGNYGKVLVDCAAALHLNHKHAKAYYRCIKALIALRRYDEARDCCNLAFSCNPGNQTFVTLAHEIDRKIQARDAEDAKRKAKEEREKAEDDELKAAIAAREYNVVVDRNEKFTLAEESDQDSEITDSDDEDNEENKIKLFAQNQAIYSQHGAHTIKYIKDQDLLTFPVVFAYPEFNQSDLIDAFPETVTFASQLETVFAEPAPWDNSGRYRADNLEIFTQARSEDGKSLKLIHVGKQLTLSHVLKLKNFYVVNGFCVFFVMPEKDSFTKMFKKRFKVRKIAQGRT